MDEISRAGTAAALAARIIGRIGELARISETPDALTRVFLSTEHRAAADLILRWMSEAGLAAHMDEIGNAVGRYEGETPGAPCLMLGSHYDTVRDAGKWDGPLGLLAAIECVGDLARRGVRLPFALEVTGFADEEGARFSSTLLGSRAVAGTFDPGAFETRDAAGLRMREAMASFGLDPAKIRRAARRRGDILAFVELHIEQGPVLEAANLPVGAVTAISGASRFRVELEGMAGHAGTVPMGMRRDALAGAAECIAAVERHCSCLPAAISKHHSSCGAGIVGTVGQIEAAPGASNVIPGRAVFSIDIRAPEDTSRRQAVSAAIDAIDEIAARRRLRARITKTHETRTAVCAPWLRQQIAGAIEAEGYPVLELPSGAGHDGMALIDITDIGMIFVRCAGGISHHPAEHVEPDDVEAAARVLLRFIETFKPSTGERP